MESKKELEHQLKELWPQKRQELYAKLKTDYVWLVSRRLINEMSFEKLAKMYDQNEQSITMLFNWVIEKIRKEIDPELGLFLQKYHRIISRLENLRLRTKKQEQWRRRN